MVVDSSQATLVLSARHPASRPAEAVEQLYVSGVNTGWLQKSCFAAAFVSVQVVPN
jgi:hypothetical protein